MMLVVVGWSESDMTAQLTRNAPAMDSGVLLTAYYTATCAPGGRRRLREAEWENDPDDGCGDDGAAKMIQAAEREIRARSHREAETRGLILSALPPAPAPSVGRNQPCPCGSGRKSKKCCGR